MIKYPVIGIKLILVIMVYTDWHLYNCDIYKFIQYGKQITLEYLIDY